MEPYLALTAATINQAIQDYKTLRFHPWGLSPQQQKKTYKDAKDFLFTNRLPQFLKTRGLNVNANYIRKFATSDESSFSHIRKGI